MRKRIGEFLVEKGVLTKLQVEQILQHGRKTGMRFGEAGTDLGVLSRDALIRVFGPSYTVPFFHIEPGLFPKISQDLFSVDVLLRLGALPLGFKTEHKFFRARKILNLGLLDPARKDAADEALRLAVAKLGAKEVQGVKVFLILADQYLQILHDTYGVTDAVIQGHDPAQIDGTLSMFLEHDH